MLRLSLTDEQRGAVQALRHDPSLHPSERDRVEMVLLAAVQWSAPRIATHLNCHAKTVRLVLKRFAVTGVASLRRHRPGPPPDSDRRQQVITALNALLGQDRTWTARQLAEALSAQGITLSTRHTRRYRHDLGATWRRTVHSLQHKQDPGKVARARQQRAGLKKSR